MKNTFTQNIKERHKKLPPTKNIVHAAVSSTQKRISKFENCETKEKY